MTIHSNFITEANELELSERTNTLLEKIPQKGRGERNRITRFGWDYTDPHKWLGDIPDWTWNFFSWPDGTPQWDSVTINEYLKGQRIAPHIDSPAFGDVAILSLLADATMRFVSPTGEIRDFLLPRWSLAVMSGELRSRWTHETLPLEADQRISLVYRKRIA